MQEQGIDKLISMMDPQVLKDGLFERVRNHTQQLHEFNGHL